MAIAQANKARMKGGATHAFGSTGQRATDPRGALPRLLIDIVRGVLIVIALYIFACICILAPDRAGQSPGGWNPASRPQQAARDD
jgi:hypothetical protein